jgi:hypothetical protein
MTFDVVYTKFFDTLYVNNRISALGVVTLDKAF